MAASLRQCNYWPPPVGGSEVRCFYAPPTNADDRSSRPAIGYEDLIDSVDCRRDGVAVDLSLRTLLLAAVLFGFVSFTAAIGAEFSGRSVGLPRWARSCVVPGRAATTLGRLGRTLVFIVMTAASPVLIFAVLADSLRTADPVSTLASVLAIAGTVLWLAYLVRWLRMSSPTAPSQ